MYTAIKRAHIRHRYWLLLAALVNAFTMAVAHPVAQTEPPS